MCGIFGWIKHHEPLTDDELRLARRATRTLAHRGPDAEGLWHDGRVFMGHRRLSVLDLRPEANQPFHDPRGRLTVSYNGEVYNFEELKPALAQAGFEFRTRCDTEVILAAFLQHGPDAFRDFDGMYAVAIHDRRDGRHFLFRDPMGQKPLYYFAYPGGLVYASELRALLSIDTFAWTLDREAFLKYLAHNYYPGEVTPIAEIRKLPPGSMLEATPAGPRICTFWSSVPGDRLLDITAEEAAAETLRLFRESCRISLRSDVPYGVFLSGGIDSTLVTKLCQEYSPDVAAFAVSMSEADYDESVKAQRVARQLGIRQFDCFLMNRDSVITSLDRYLASVDEPHGDPGFVNAFFLATSVRPHITVALAGDGGDELFGGYLPYMAGCWADTLRPVAPLLGALHGPMLRWLHGGDSYAGLQLKLRGFLQGFPSTPATLYPLLLSTISPEELARLCPWQDRGFFSRLGEPGTLFGEFQQSLGSLSDRSAVQMGAAFYQRFFLPECVCMHTDRSAMQSSLEVRSPMLSLPLVEFANRLPDRLKADRRHTKIILRQITRDLGFPASIWRQKKQGFTFPIARWLKTYLRERMDRLLELDDWPVGLIDAGELSGILGAHLSGARNNYRILFNLMVFRAWLRNYPSVRIPSRGT